jgi:hypothetical protein
VNKCDTEQLSSAFALLKESYQALFKEPMENGLLLIKIKMVLIEFMGEEEYKEWINGTERTNSRCAGRTYPRKRNGPACRCHSKSEIDSALPDADRSSNRVD